MAVSGARDESQTPVPRRLPAGRGGRAGARGCRAPVPALLGRAPTAAQAFHGRLRAVERALAPAAADAAPARAARIAAQAGPPALGDKRTFDVLKSADADGTSCRRLRERDRHGQVRGPAGGHLPRRCRADHGRVHPGRHRPESAACSTTSSTPSTPPPSAASPTSTATALVLVLLTDRVNRPRPTATTASVVVGYFFAPGPASRARSASNGGGGLLRV